LPILQHDEGAGRLLARHEVHFGRALPRLTETSRSALETFPHAGVGQRDLARPGSSTYRLISQTTTANRFQRKTTKDR
jgi:hypothetical protein